MRIRPSFVLALASLTLLAGLPATPSLAADIDPGLERRLETAAPDELIKVFVLLDAQLDSAFVEEVRELGRRDRRARVISELKRIARDTQAPLLAELDALRAAGEVGRVDSLWIANLLVAELSPATIGRLAADSAVRSIHPVREYASGEATDDLPADPAQLVTSEGAVEPNITLIGAPDVWALGYQGQGMVVANIDTGTDPTHPDLADHIWFNVDETLNGVDDDNNGFVDDRFGWDFESNDNDPRPSGSSHGTNTAGIVVGDGTNGRQTGVAPQANIMILKACGESPAMGAVQYAVMNGADAITSSCSYKFPFRPAYGAWRQIAENTLAAGVPHANSIGNQGQQTGTYPIPYNISAPGIAPTAWHHPSQSILGGFGSLVATGGVNVNLSQYPPSGKGPGAWEDIQQNYPSQLPIPSQYWDYPWANGSQQGLLKPDVVMPTNVFTTSPGGGYTSFGGTSAATPHTGGSLALLLSAAPNATPADLSEALQTSALDLGDPGKDNQYGAGLPDLLTAAGSIAPVVTPVMAPYGQAVDPGDPLTFDVALVNNTGSAQAVDVRFDFIVDSSTFTRFGPRRFNLGPGESRTGRLNFSTSAAFSDSSIVVEFVVETDTGAPIATADVEAYIR